MIGKTLDHYAILDLLGRGGMGEVYRARDTKLGREVAIKILPPAVANDAARLSRFEQEARTLSAMNHPHLATLFELGRFEGSPYMVMELIDGESLRDRLGSTDASTPPRRALEIAIQIAQGLAAAHGEGVIHRDLKPDNILITPDGRVKILDFGLAKLMAAPAEDQHLAQTLVHATEPGVVMGTVGYMSPEQVRGGAVDHRSDIFALGVVLYEMLSGRRAFEAPTSAETMTAILHSDPPALESGPQLSPSIERIVRRCLEKEPQRRFQSAHDLAYALEAVKDLSGALPQMEAEALTRGARVPLFVLIGVAVLAVAAGMIAGRWLFGGGGDERDEAANGRMVQLTFDEGAELDPSISPDGNSLVYQTLDGGDLDIFQQRVGGENRINLTAECDDDDSMPAYSPDGTMIAFRSDREGGGLFVMGATGESVRRLSDFGFNPSWSPDGRRVLFCDESIVVPTARNVISELWSVDVTGGRPERFFAGDGVEPVQSPSGLLHAFWGLPSATGKRILYTRPVAGGEPHPLNDDDFFNWNPTWSGNGRALYFTSNRGGTMDLWRLPMDPTSGRATGQAQPVTMSTLTISNPSITRDGSRLVFNSQFQSSRISRFSFPPEENTAPPTVLLDGSRDIWEVEPSPDGRWLALKAADPYEDLFVASIDGSGLRRLTNDVYKDREICFSPDSKTIYFFSDRSGRYEVWSIRIDGSGLTQISDTQGNSPATPFISPDGKMIVAQSTESSSGFIDLTQELPARKIEWIDSPDEPARFLSVLWYPDSKGVLGILLAPGFPWYRFDTETRTYTRLAARAPDVLQNAGGFFQPRWADPGRSVLQLDGAAVEEVDLETGARRQVLRLDLAAATVATSPDGRWLYVLQKSTESDIWMLDLSRSSSR